MCPFQNASLKFPAPATRRDGDRLSLNGKKATSKNGDNESLYLDLF